MSSYQDPYRVLGVSPDATEEQITKAYRNLAKKYHPDLNPGDAQAERKMREINAAYEQIKAMREGKATGAGPGSSRSSGYGGYGGYRGYGPGGYGGYGGFGGFGGYGGYGGSGQNGAYTGMDAVRIYLRTHRFNEALYLLNSMSQRDAQWYYYSALANEGVGRHIVALEHAGQAVRMEPGNEEYRRLYQTLQSGGTAYRQRQGGLSNMGELLYCCAMAACLGSCMYGGMCYPVFCCY